MLWVFVVFVTLSATGLLFAAQGPLRGTPSAPIVRVFAVIQYLLAAVLVVAELTGFTS